MNSSPSFASRDPISVILVSLSVIYNSSIWLLSCPVSHGHLEFI
jgi:hypothetical protein